MIYPARTVLFSAIAFISFDAAVAVAHRSHHRHHRKLRSQAPAEEDKVPERQPSREGETFKICDSMMMNSNVPGMDPFTSVSENMDKCNGFYELTNNEFEEKGELVYSMNFFGQSVKLTWDKENLQWVCADTNDGKTLLTVPWKEGPQFSTLPPVYFMGPPGPDSGADSTYLENDGETMNSSSKTQIHCSDTNWKPWSCTEKVAQGSRVECQGKSWPFKQFCNWDDKNDKCEQPKCSYGAETWQSCSMPAPTGGAAPVPEPQCKRCEDIGDHCGAAGEIGGGNELFAGRAMAYEVCPQCGCLAVTCEWQILDDHGEGSTACSNDRNEWTDAIFGETHKPGTGLKNVDECKTKCQSVGKPFAVWAPSDVEPTCICQTACDDPVEKKNRFAFELVCKTPEEWEAEQGKDGEDDDSEDDDQEEETTTPKPEPPPVVAVVNIHNLDYTTMARVPLLHAQVEAVVRDSIASQAGDDIQSDEVSLVSWPGSVRARAVIKPADDVEAITLVAELKKTSRDLDKMITKKVAEIQGIKIAIADGKKIKTDIDVLVAEKISSVSRVMSKPKGHNHLEEVYELEKKASAARLNLGAIAEEEREVHGRLLAAAENATKQEKLLAKARDNVEESWYGKRVKSGAASSKFGLVALCFVALFGCFL